MKTKRFFACVLSLVMIINLLPTFSMTVAAADISTSTASISVGQTELTEDTFYLCNGDVPTSDGADETNYNLYYDSTTSTLTLNNAVLTKENQSNTLMVPGGTIINVCGNNAINSGTGIQTTSNGDLVIDGTGMLSITSTTEGVLIPNTLSGNIEIKGSVNLTFGTHNAISNKNGNNTIGENAVINATNISYFLYSNAGDVTIQGNAKVTANRVINTASGNIRITDTSEVKIEGTDCECGLRTETGDIEISGTAKLITSTTKSGINTFGGDLLIGKNAVVSLTSQNADNGAAINFSSSAASVEGQQITVKGSLTINCVNAAIGISTPNATFELDGGSYNVTAANLGFIGTKENTKFIAKNNSAININATTAGIYMNSDSGNEITIKDSKLTIGGGAAGIIMICKGSPTFNNSDVEITASSYVSYTKPTLSYDHCRTIIAGDNKTAATEITYENIGTTNYHQNKYVKITRASEHSGNPCEN